MSKKKNVVIALVVVVILVLSILGIIMYKMFANKENGEKNNGIIREETAETPQYYADEDESKKPVEVQTLSANEQYIRNFLREAQTYTPEEDSSEERSASNKFYVVTDGVVSDSNSLDGLTGPALAVGKVALAAGFRYDKNQNIFYSESYSWQRLAGFTNVYDVGAAMTGMYYDTLRLYFDYKGMNYRIQLWKGRYGITTGAEMGIYYKKLEQSEDYYVCVPDNETITMSFALFRNDDLYMTRGPEKHWWLTGFKLFDMAAPKELTMHATFFMTDEEQADALEEQFKKANFVEGLNYQRLGLTMTIIWH